VIPAPLQTNTQYLTIEVTTPGILTREVVPLVLPREDVELFFILLKYGKTKHVGDHLRIVCSVSEIIYCPNTNRFSIEGKTFKPTTLRVISSRIQIITHSRGGYSEIVDNFWIFVSGSFSQARLL